MYLFRVPARICDVAQPVSSWIVTAEAGLRSQLIASRICAGKSSTETGFLRVLWLSPVSIISAVIHTHLFIYQRETLRSEFY
jgi:hypothetical protein